MYFKVAPRQTISAAVLPEVRTPLVLHHSHDHPEERTHEVCQCRTTNLQTTSWDKNRRTVRVTLAGAAPPGGRRAAAREEVAARAGDDPGVRGGGAPVVVQRVDVVGREAARSGGGGRAAGPRDGRGRGEPGRRERRERWL